MDLHYFKNNKKTTAAAVLVIAVGAIWYAFFRGPAMPVYDTVTATVGSIVQEVSVTGKLKSAEMGDLSFEQGGKVAQIPVEVGDTVTAGALLASLSNADFYAQLTEAQSLEKSEQAKLDQLKIGTRPEELAVTRAKVSAAETDLEEAKKTLRERISDLYTKSDDAIRTQADQFITSAQSEQPQLSFQTESTLRRTIETGRRDLEVVLTDWNTAIANNEDLDVLADRSTSAIEKVKTFLGNTAYALSIASSYSSLSQTTIDGYNADISAARTAVSTSANNLVSAISSVKTTSASLALVRQELLLEEAGATNEDVRAQEAVVEKVHATVLGAQANLTKSIIVAPFSGTVTKINMKRGETIAAHTPVISLITPSRLEIEAFVPEADVAKVQIDNTARVTLDAYEPDQYFEAKVIKIDPAETIIEGVSTYKVTLLFIDPNGLGKSGMTANVDILTASKDNVVAIPARAIEYRDGSKYVQVLSTDGTPEERKVETGIRGSDGKIEIVSGVADGEQVVRYTQ